MVNEQGNIERVYDAMTMPAVEPQSLPWRIGFGTKLSDKQVLDSLKKYSYEHYYPMVREWRPKPKRKLPLSQRNNAFAQLQPTTVPVFSRYIFVRFDLKDGRWRELFELLGVEGMLYAEEETRHVPMIVPTVLIERLKAKEVNGALPSKTALLDVIRSIWPTGDEVPEQGFDFAVGDAFRVRSGPWEGFNATVYELPKGPAEALDESTCMRLLVKAFNREVVSEFRFGDLEKL